MKGLLFLLCAVVLIALAYCVCLPTATIPGESSQNVHEGSSFKACFLRQVGYVPNERMQEPPRLANPNPIPKRIDIGHIEGKGIGYDKGYSKLSIILGPEYRIGHTLSLIDLRGVVFDDGTFGANVGYIARILPKSICEVFGLNIFYDFRQGRHGNFNQVSGGFEVLNRRWEIHANASVPCGARKHYKKSVYPTEVCKKYQLAENAFDANVGYYMVNSKNFQLYAAAGPYYLFGQLHTSTWGGKAVLRPQFGDYFSVELSVSHDNFFDTIYQVNAVFTLPLYHYSSRLKNKKGPCRTRNYQLYQPIDRDIVLHNKNRCRMTSI